MIELVFNREFPSLSRDCSI